MSDVKVNGKLPRRSFPSVPHRRRTHDAGFVTEAMPATLVPVPSRVPAGMHAYRAGVIAPPGATAVGVRTRGPTADRG